MRRIPKIWRELPKEERFKIPTKYFGIDEETITKIRDIKDTKRRLIEAAKIQYESFNDIHSYLTTWIAGYGSDVIIRKSFGSTQKLLNLFFEPLKFPRNLNPSWQDIKRRVTIPQQITEQLAEETGIHIGDGNLHIATNNDGTKSYRYGISGDLINDFLYHENYVSKLIKSIYNIAPHIIRRGKKNSVESYCKSRLLVEFKNKILKLPVGPKKEIRIPKEILKNDEFQRKCIIGIIDTDFSLTSHVAITGKMNNLFVTKEMTKILKLNKIKHVYKEYNKYARFYINKNGAIKIIEEWGLKNQKHLSKYHLLQEFDKFIPFSTTPERLAILEGKLDIKELEKICSKRSPLSKL